MLITLDGFRWQELFTGADPKLIANRDYVGDTTSLKENYWRDTPAARAKSPAAVYLDERNQNRGAARQPGQRE